MGNKRNRDRVEYKYMLITSMITAMFLIASLFAVHSIPVVNANSGGGGQPDVFIDKNGNCTWDSGEDAFYGTHAIQMAIDNATDGDTIIVHDGVYDPITINKSITLKSGSLPVIDGHQSQPCITVSADNVVIDGFVLFNGTYGVYMNDAGKSYNLTIRNCVIKNNTQWGAIYLQQNDADKNVTVLVENNMFEWNGGDDFVIKDSAYTQAHPNEFYGYRWIVRNNTFNPCGGSPNWDYSGLGFEPALGILVENNTFNTYWGIWMDNARYVTIKNNILSYSLGDGGAGIVVWGDDSPVVTKFVTIENNSIYGFKANLYPPEDGKGIVLGGAENVTVKYNSIYENEVGIWINKNFTNCNGYWINNSNPNWKDGISINYNNIYGNDEYGIECMVDGIDATCNWWGSANGPTHPSNTYNVGYQGDNGSNNVKYCPWLLNPYPQPTNVSSFNITQADFNMTGFSFNPDGNPSTPTYPSSGPDYLNITSVIGTYNMDIPPAGTKYVVVISGWLEADFDENGTWDIHFDFFENIGPRTSPGPSTSWVGSMPFTVAYNGQSFDLIAQYDIDVNGSYPSDSFGDNAHANFTISGPDIMTFNAMLAYMDNISGGDDGYIDGLVRGNISVSCIPLGCPVKNINTGKCYCSIQSAIDNAADGDTIIVGPGIYRESPIINKSLNIIGDPVIDAHGSEYGVQIQANYTLVENFTIYNYTKIGIYIHNDSFTLQNVTVNNCRIFNSTYNTGKRGIELREARDVSISDCQIHNNSEIGIYILYSENCKLENNTISNNSEYGFKLSSSNYNSLLNNTLVGNEQGIYLSKYSGENTIANNHISASCYGIYVKSSYNQILNNTLLCNGGDGIYLESAKNNLVENNTVSGGYQGIYLYKSGENTLSNNTIKSIGDRSNFLESSCILLEFSSNNVIDNNTISDGVNGIYLDNSEKNFITNNSIFNSKYALQLSSYSKYNSLLNNTLVGNEQGIYLSKYSGRNTLANNRISTSYYGIYVKTSYNQILNNTLLCNGGKGIYLESANNNLVENNTISGGYYGMHLYKSDNNVLSNNTVNNTLLYTDKAIYLESADSNLIDNNTISGGHQGIYLYKSDKNTLYNNTLKSIEYCCILLVNSSNNVIDNNNISNSYYGISLYDSGNNILSNNTVKSIEYRCILLEFSSNNVIGNNAIDNNTISDGVDGIYLDNSEKNSITNNSISNTQNGIWLSSSNENRISDNFLSGTSWDLYVLDSEGNLISNNTFSTSYPTTASFRYKGNFAVRGVNNPPENPDGFDDTGSFLNISSLSDTSTWINLSICYNESNVIINEDYLLIWMHNETGWHKEGWNGTRYLDTTKNVIGVNITNPEGIFAPLQDIQPPVSTKTIGDPNCTIGGEDWITGYTPVWLDAEDNINGTGVDAIYYRVWYNESWHPADSQDSYGGNHNITMYRNIYWYVYSNNTVNFGPIYFMEEGKHYMEFFSTDRAGNEENHTNQTIYVDNTPPQVTIEMGIPSYIQDGKIFINSTTPIWINVTDMMNLYLIRWTIWNETGAVYDSGISEKNLTLYIAEEGKYTIGYWAEDGLGNRWPASGYDNDTTFYVDNTPPETDLTIGKPNHTKNNTLFVTARTPFNLSSEDGGKYPVGTEKICYRVWNIYTGWSDWRIYFANITLHEEGLHYIEYYAEDCLGNRGNVLNITCYVDDVPPVTTGRGYYPIYLMAIDPGWDGCPEVGVCCIHYRYRIGEGNWSDWFVNETNENLTLWIPNSSVSPGGEPIYLEYYSEDLLGNKENINYDVFTGEVNHPPNKPSNPSPANGATGVDIDVTLSWQCSDPDGDNLTYDVYFGTGENQLKKVSGNQSSTTYKPSSLNYSTTYYWKIVAWDEHGEISEGPVWRFTTEEGIPNSPPTVSITRPKNLLYVRDREILSLSLPLIIGPITIEVNASDSDGVVKRVDFYIDHTLKYSDTTAPFSWRWDSRAFGFKVIEVVAYDDKGAHQRSTKEVLIFNLAIL